MPNAAKSCKYGLEIGWQNDIFQFFFHFFAIGAQMRRFKGVGARFEAVGEKSVVGTHHTCITTKANDALVVGVFEYFVVDEADFLVENFL